MKYEELYQKAEKYYKDYVIIYKGRNKEDLIEGCIRGYYMALFDIIQDNEIEKAIDPYLTALERDEQIILAAKYFRAGAKWYRSELLKRANQ